LSGTYKSLGGESWSTIARQTTGNDLDAAAIRRANPSLREPLPAGETIQVPMMASPQESIGEGELDIVVDGQTIGTFDGFEIAFCIDAISKCSFVVPNEAETRRIFTPLGSQRITIDHLGQRPCVIKQCNYYKYLQLLLRTYPVVLDS
jgi:hypothetical protein